MDGNRCSVGIGMVKDKHVSLNLFGCCVLRDIFGLHENDGGYQIKRYVQLANPISVVTGSPLIREIDTDDEVFGDISEFWKRCQVLELKKQIPEYLMEEEADYLIFDAAEFRRKLLYFPENQGWFSENYTLGELFGRYIQSGVISDEYDVLDPLDIDDRMINRYLCKFCDLLDTMYDRNRMILFEIKAGIPHLDTENTEESVAAESATFEIFNKRIDYAFEYIKKNMKGIHIVEFPDNVMLDYKHKWGRNLLHYEKWYYDYALEAVDKIIGVER